MMNWYPTLVFYIGITDAAIIMVGGVAVALMLLFGGDVTKLLGRIGPALGTLIGSTIAAAIVLGITKWALG